MRIPSDWRGFRPSETSSYWPLVWESLPPTRLLCLCAGSQPSRSRVPGSPSPSLGFRPSGSFVRFPWLLHVRVWRGPVCRPCLGWQHLRGCGWEWGPTCGYWESPRGSRCLWGGRGFHPIGCLKVCVQGCVLVCVLESKKYKDNMGFTK